MNARMGNINVGMNDRSEYYRQYYQKNKAKKNQYSKEYIKKHADKNKEYCRKYYEKTRAARGIINYHSDEFERYVIENENYDLSEIKKLSKNGWNARTIASWKNLKLSTVERILLHD